MDATRCPSQAQEFWTVLGCIHGFCSQAELRQYRQRASDVTKVACEGISHYTARLLLSRCASRGMSQLSGKGHAVARNATQQEHLSTASEFSNLEEANPLRVDYALL